PSGNDRQNGKFFPDSGMDLALPRWEKLVFFLIGWLGFQILGELLSVIIAPIYRAGVIDYNLANTLLTFISYLLIATAFVMFFFFDKRKTYKTFAKDFTNPSFLGYAVLAFAAMIAVNVFFSMIYSSTCPDIYGANSNQNSINDVVKAFPIAMFFPLVLFAPFNEELTYRIGLVDGIGHRGNHKWLGIIFSSLIFASIHFDFTSISGYLNLAAQLNSGVEGITVEMVSGALIAMQNEFLNLPVYIMSGFILCFSYAKTGKISTSMTAHSLNNLISFISILVATSASSGTSSEIAAFFTRIM
ncbi:MAG: CPBP family intramembrane glutamic endopeptidase, partial [Bacilli bacterium]